jgi:hypothetical protein
MDLDDGVGLRRFLFVIILYTSASFFCLKSLLCVSSRTIYDSFEAFATLFGRAKSAARNNEPRGFVVAARREKRCKRLIEAYDSPPRLASPHSSLSFSDSANKPSDLINNFTFLKNSKRSLC